MYLAKDSDAGKHSVTKEDAMIFNMKTSISWNACVKEILSESCRLWCFSCIFLLEFFLLAVCLKQEEGKMKRKGKGSYTTLFHFLKTKKGCVCEWSSLAVRF